MTIKESLKKYMAEKRLERSQLSAAKKIASSKARAAALKEREKQEIRFAVEKQRYVGERRIKAMQGGQQSGFGGFIQNFGRTFNEPPKAVKTPMATRTSYKLKPVKVKGKTYFRRVKVTKKVGVQPMQQQPTGLFGGGNPADFRPADLIP